MKWFFLFLILAAFQLVSAKTIVNNTIAIYAPDMNYCELAPDASDGYAHCHNYISINRTSGTVTLNSPSMTTKYSNSSLIQNAAFNAVTMKLVNVTEYITNCTFLDPKDIGNRTTPSNCVPVPIIVTKMVFSNAKPFTSISMTINTTTQWFDNYWEQPNGYMKQWNFTMKSGAVAVTIDPNTTSICGNIAVANQTYLLNQSISAAGNCIDVLVDNITLDCYGFNVSSTDNALNSYGVRVSGHTNATIKNCNIVGYQSGIYFLNSNNSFVTNTDVSKQKQVSTTLDTNAYGIRIENSNNITMTGITASNINATSSASSGAAKTGSAFGIYASNSYKLYLNGLTSYNLTQWSRVSDGEGGFGSGFSATQYSLYLNKANQTQVSSMFGNNIYSVYGINFSNSTLTGGTLYEDPEGASLLFGAMPKKIFLAQSQNNSFSYITMNSTNAAFIQTQQISNGNSFSNFNIFGKFSVGLTQQISLTSSNNTYIQNSNFSNLSNNFFLTSSADNLVINNNTFNFVPNAVAAAYFRTISSSNNLTFSNNSEYGMDSASGDLNFYQSGTSAMTNALFYNNYYENYRGALYVLDGKNVVIQNEIYKNVSANNLLWIGSALSGTFNYTVINCTGFNITNNVTYSTSNNNNITVQWYVAANITDADGIYLPNSNLNITNATGTSPQYINLQNNVNSMTLYTLVTEFIGNNTRNVSYTPHTFTAMKSSSYVTWNSNTTSYSISSTQIIPLILTTVASATSAVDKFMGGFLTPRIYNLFWMRRLS